MSIPTTPILNRKDFVSNQDPRWCPGCGDYAILSTVQRVMPELGIAKENFVWVSGIGCSSRLPYYIDTFGLHTIHGRALPIATGIRVANPSLSVWVATGDGDALSIGGNHLMHCLRRNVDVKILLFNNRIYGLTKGQYSPTSELGKVTKTSPTGAADAPIDPISFALGCGATFVARTYDVSGDHLAGILRRAAEHRGTAFIEILQNCPVFNEGAFDAITQRSAISSRQLRVENGKPLLFGENSRFGLKFDAASFGVSVLDLGVESHRIDEVMVFDESNPLVGSLLASLPSDSFPVPMGVIHASSRPTYEALLAQRPRPLPEPRIDALDQLFSSGQVWQVE